MRVIAYELKKLLRPKYALLALVIFLGAAFIHFSESNGFYIKPYLVSGDENSEYSTGKAEGAYAEAFRTYKWFTDAYGFTVDDGVIEKLDALEFPLMEKRIEQSALFQKLNVHSVAEYKTLLDKYTNVGCASLMGVDSVYVEAETDYSQELCDDILFSGNEFTSFYPDWYISHSKLFKENDISSYREYTDLAIANPELFQLLQEEFDKNIAPEIRSARLSLPEADALRLETARFWMSYNVKRIYELYRENPLGLMKVEGSISWSSEFSHTRSVYTKSAMNNRTVTTDENGVEWYTSVPLPEYTERLLSRGAQLGEGFFSIKPDNLNDGYDYSAGFLFISAACISLFLAGLYAVNDRKAGVFPAVYSSKTGRKIWRLQLLAVVTSSALINTVFVAALLILSRSDLYSVYYNLPLSSFVTAEMFWLDINMWQYIALAIAFSYAVTLAFSLAAYFVCSFCAGYISAFAAVVPFCGAVIALYLGAFRWLFTLPEWAGEDPLLLAIILLAGAFCVTAHRRKTLVAVV